MIAAIPSAVLIGVDGHRVSVEVHAVSYTHLDVYKRQPEDGSTPTTYVVANLPGDSQGAVWMGGCLLYTSIRPSRSDRKSVV